MTTPPDPKTVVIMGVPFHDVTMAETLAHIDALIAAGVPRYLATANLDFTAQASEDVELQRILLEAHLVLCDGTPLVWASKWLGAPIRERVAGSDLMPVLTAHCAAKGHRMYLLGATDKTLAMASAKMVEANPNLIIAGTYAPPIAKLHDFNNEDILTRIHAAKPDVLIVCFGCPKQEKWIYMNLDRLGVPVSIGLGATLDFVAGNFKRAPIWMRKTGLEWVFRLLQEPRRLFNRYLFDLLFFVRALRRQRAVLRAAATPIAEPEEIATVAPVPAEAILVWSGRIDAARVHAQELPLPVSGDNPTPQPVYLDLAKVTYLDSTGLGLLLRLFREAQARGAGFALLRPSESVVRLLAAMRIDRLLPAAETIEQARVLANSGHHTRGIKANELTLTLDGDLTADTCPTTRQWIESSWEAAPQARALILNFERVRFMDSSGLGLLIALQRNLGRRPGAQLRLSRMNPNLRNVIQIAKLEPLFTITDEPGKPSP
jgi:N-acetylglucosaminyldiphosphoundecaprenol N-acetyl-beta-D-mannosaminyltransferase